MKFKSTKSLANTFFNLNFDELLSLDKCETGWLVTDEHYKLTFTFETESILISTFWKESRIYYKCFKTQYEFFYQIGKYYERTKAEVKENENY